MINDIAIILCTKSRRIGGLILLFAFIGFPLLAQGEMPRDSVSRPELSGSLGRPVDTTNVAAKNQKDSQAYPDTLDHSPRKAMLLALAFPGLGQAYNKKYFKMPIVYAAFAGVGYWIYFNTGEYRTYLEQYEANQTSNNERFVKFYRRQLELSYITLVGVYALQVVDAYVDAHLFYWDMSPDLSLRVEPSFEPTLFPEGMPANNYGFKFKLTF